MRLCEKLINILYSAEAHQMGHITQRESEVLKKIHDDQKKLRLNEDIWETGETLWEFDLKRDLRKLLKLNARCKQH